MFPLILTVLNRDYNRYTITCYEGLMLEEGGASQAEGSVILFLGIGVLGSPT